MHPIDGDLGWNDWESMRAVRDAFAGLVQLQKFQGEKEAALKPDLDLLYMPESLLEPGEYPKDNGCPEQALRHRQRDDGGSRTGARFPASQPRHICAKA